MSQTPESRMVSGVRRRLRDAGKSAPDHAVVRYARALVLADRAWREMPVFSLVGETDRGGEKVHPALKAWMDAERVAVEFGQAIGLEPVRQAGSPGRPAGAVSAADRKSEPPKFSRLRAVK